MAVVVLALFLFVCAAACGIVAGWNRHYAHSLTVRTLRQANAFKAGCVSVGLVAQVLALVALGVSVVFVLGRTPV